LVKHVFGPVPSRRLGRSLGVNNIPAKTCSYNCVYCQLGRTLSQVIDRRRFYSPQEILHSVEEHIRKLKDKEIDYITFAASGEPTLDINLGKTADLLKSLGYPIAILTNSSLLYREDVRNDLLLFDYVSLKLDAVTTSIWRRVNRPHELLDLDRILDGVSEFRRLFKGRLVTETMLIEGVDYSRELEKIALFLKKIKPDIAYISVPTRPPAEKWVRPASETTVVKAYELFKKISCSRVELLTSPEGTDFASTGDIEEDLLSTATVHPIREDALRKMLEKTGSSWSVVEKLLAQNKLVAVEYQGVRYYIRRVR